MAVELRSVGLCGNGEGNGPQLSLFGSPAMVVGSVADVITFRCDQRLCSGPRVPLRIDGTHVAHLQVISSQVHELRADHITYDIQCVSDLPLDDLMNWWHCGAARNVA